MSRESAPSETWTFLSNHAHVLICVAREPDARVRDIALAVGITERAILRIIAELVDAGIVERIRHGRRNHYAIHPDQPLRHPIEAHCTVGALLKMTGPSRPRSPAQRGSR